MIEGDEDVPDWMNLRRIQDELQSGMTRQNALNPTVDAYNVIRVSRQSRLNILT